VCTYQSILHYGDGLESLNRLSKLSARFLLIWVSQAGLLCFCGGAGYSGTPAAKHKIDIVSSLCEEAKLKPHRAEDLKYRGMTLLQAGKCREAVAVFDEFANCCPSSWRAFACCATAKAIAANEEGCLQDIVRYFYIKRNASFHMRDSAQRADLEDKEHPGPIAPPELSINIADCNHLRDVALRKLGKGSSANQFAQAVISFFEHDYRRAIKELAMIKGSDSEGAPVLAMRSMCERAVAAFDVSIKEARAAISKEPDKRVYYDTLDGAYFAYDKREEGLKELNGMNSAHPGNTALLLTIADVNSQLGNRDQARIILSKLLSSKPSTFEALMGRADIYKADLMNEKALADYKAASTLSPRDGKALEGMGFSCYELNRIDQASRYFESVMALGYDLRRVCAAQSMCLEKQGKPALAQQLRAASQYFMY
jgi:tetratricopeptide (TPR) repeat protein